MHGGKERDAYLALMAAQPWGDLHAELLAHLVKKRVPPREAKELAGDALGHVYDPDRSPWNPASGPMLGHLKWVARGLRGNAFKKLARQKTSLAGDDVPDPDPDSDRDPVARNARDALMAVYRDKLVASLAKKPRALQVLELEEDGVSTVDDQHAAMPGATREQVYEARRAVYDAAREIIAREKDPDVRRAWGLREGEATP